MRRIKPTKDKMPPGRSTTFSHHRNPPISKQPTTSETYLPGTSGSQAFTAPENAPTKPLSLMHHFTLTFHERDSEIEYGRFFLEKNLPVWRRTVWLLFFAATVLYVYVMSKLPSEGESWEQTYGPQEKGKVTVDQIVDMCPKGWFCMECDPNRLCNSYYLLWDLAFWLVSFLLPFLVILTLSYKLRPSQLARHIHWLSIFFITITGTSGLLLRYFVVEPKTAITEPALLLSMLLYLTFNFMKVRFIYTVPSAFLMLCVYAGLNLPLVLRADYGTTTARKTFIVSLFSLATTAFVVSYNCYESETFYRTQFLSAQELKRKNVKLTNQLKTLQKVYEHKEADFDSPFEKSVMILRSMMADPSLGAAHLMALNRIMELLGSSHLLTPDLEGQLGNLDTEQEAWLFSEIAPRRKVRASIDKPVPAARRKSNPVDVSDLPINDSLKQSLEPSNFLRDHPSLSGLSLPQSQQLGGGGESAPAVPSLLQNRDPRDFGSLSSLSTGDLANLLGRTSDYNFPMFEFAEVSKGRSLATLTEYLFRKADLFSTLGLPLDKFRNFIGAVEKGYRAELPYYDHPGVNNNFLISTWDSKALLYNDRSVLENHHLAGAFQLLMKPENNFLAHIPKTDFQAMREMMIELVLATDLSQHFQLMSMFKNKIATPESYKPLENLTDRTLLYRILIKCADVSNPTKAWPLYERWCRCVIQEFLQQGDMEKRLGLPCSPYMDRDNVNVPGCQLGFIDYVVMPLYDAAGKYVPLGGQIGEIQKNREFCAKLKAQGLMHLPSEFSIASVPSPHRMSIARDLTNLSQSLPAPSFNATTILRSTNGHNNNSSQPLNRAGGSGPPGMVKASSKGKESSTSSGIGDEVV
ncbi:High affinity cAMP-specific 3',5'-cyclic phosphodiesterase 7A [Rhizophlyctis rosea]|uniref:High affinity cAMP-specific 3',5'-cyclic phosphodiesterase 7A n=1 Tax=Rhizophlyctis rosea TaxID=64517 RepID=A0AAD5SDQ1_9FUNG|nr:High affinity cAMP-specific 3',5'-cyclic phosphodiesterase 7A [Rhizophlyctis rosea]